MRYLKRRDQTDSFTCDGCARRRRVAWLNAALLTIAMGWTTSATAASIADTDQVGVPYELRPGVVVHPVDGLIYLMSTNRGVDAINVAAGLKVWHSDDGDRPLLLFGKRSLLLQAEPERPGEMPLVVVDAGTGRTLERVVVPIPGDISARIDEQLMSVFEARALHDGSSLIVAWRHTRRAHKGLRAAHTTSRQEALARVDFATGSVQAVPSAVWPSPWKRPLPSPVAETVAESLARAEAEGGAIPADGSSPVWAGEIVYSALRLSPVPDRTRVLRWDASGQPLDQLTLASPPGDLRFAAADGRHLLASAIDDTTSGTYRWSLFSTTNGELTTKVTLPSSAAPYAVLGQTLLYVAPPSGHRSVDGWVDVPLRLVGVNQRSGAELWTSPLRNTTYRGPDVAGQ